MPFLVCRIQVLADLGQYPTEMELEDMIVLVDKTGASI
jgi:hypothetical protein